MWKEIKYVVSFTSIFPFLTLFQLSKEYDTLTRLLSAIQNEIIQRQHSSDSISCPPFLPVVQSLVNPNKDTHKYSHTKVRSKSKSRNASVTPRSPAFSEGDLDDSLSSISVPKLSSMKSEPIPKLNQYSQGLMSASYSPKYIPSPTTSDASVSSRMEALQSFQYPPYPPSFVFLLFHAHSIVYRYQIGK